MPSTNAGLCGRWPWGGSSSNVPAEVDPRWSTEDESEAFTTGVRRIWQRPASEGSLSKDLPRLARRITIRTTRCVFVRSHESVSLEAVPVDGGCGCGVGRRPGEAGKETSTK